MSSVHYNLRSCSEMILFRVNRSHRPIPNWESDFLSDSGDDVERSYAAVSLHNKRG